MFGTGARYFSRTIRDNRRLHYMLCVGGISTFTAYSVVNNNGTFTTHYNDNYGILTNNNNSSILTTLKNSFLTPNENYSKNAFVAAPLPDKSVNDYQKIYNMIAEKMREEEEYDGYIGYGPVLLRLAWHSSGTYRSGGCPVGGSFGGTYRFDQETNDASNMGLQNAFAFLKPIKDTFDWISYGDLFTLGGVVALQEMQGPTTPWRPGRKDLLEKETPENGRLPDGAETEPSYLRSYFAQLDFLNDREIVALMGSHSLGKTHLANSGFEGPWGGAVNIFSNEYFVNLLHQKWTLEKNDAGNLQYNNPDKSFMMLPADMALIKDDKFLKIVTEFSEHQDVFAEEFKNAFTKLIENGIDFGNQKPMVFKTLDEQES